MKKQRHIIKKQVAEITVSSRRQGAAMQKKALNLLKGKIISAIDKVCSNATEPDIVYRIDKMTIDLGRLSPGFSDTDFISAFEKKFKGSLTNALNSSKTEKIDSREAKAKREPDSLDEIKNFSFNDFDLELTDYFIKTGSLPWWADADSKTAVINSVNRLIKNAPEKLLELISNSAKDLKLINRIIFQMPENVLLSISELFIAEKEPNISDTYKDAQKILSLAYAKDVSMQDIKFEIWQGIFSNIVAPKKKSSYDLTKNLIIYLSSAPQICKDFWANITKSIGRLDKDGYVFKSNIPDIVKKLASLLKDSEKYAVLRAEENRLSEQKTDIPPEYKIPDYSSVLLARETAPLSSKNKAKPPLKTKPSPQEQYALPEVNIPEEFRKLLETKSETSRNDTKIDIDKTKAVKDDAKDDEYKLPEVNIPEEFRKLLESKSDVSKDELKQTKQSENIKTDTAKGPDKTENIEDSTEIGFEDYTKVSKKADIKTKLEDSMPNTTFEAENRFTNSKTLYIDNAGIVLMHQFLPIFFKRLLYIKDNQFIHLPAIYRSILLLQHAATGESEFPEYKLCLNKILCGLKADEPISAKISLTEKEQEEVSFLLDSLIKKFPKLEKMALSEFRQTYFLREGSISIRDRIWLLRVAPDPRDRYLIESTGLSGYINFPWMRYPLFVEWG